MEWKVVMMLLQVTQAAIDKIKEELQGISPDVKNPFIRLYMGFGWGGPRLQLALEESTNPNDTVTEVEGIKFLVDSNQSAYFENVKLDYTKGAFGFGEYKLLKV